MGLELLPSRRRHALRGAVLSFSLVGALPLPLLCEAAAAADTAVKNYSIPAGLLGDALALFAASASVQLSFDPAPLASLRSAGLQGSYSVGEGFRQLLKDSGYEVVEQGPAAFSLRKSPVQAKKLATVRINADAETTSDQLPASFAGSQVAKGGRLGLLGNKSVLDTPFNITSFTVQTIENQQARSIADVLVNDPSVRMSSARTNIGEDFSIRGFPVASADIALNGMYGLMPFFRVPTEMAERVEVLKGPSALLNGMPPSGNVGGAINVVSKRADATPLTRLTTNYFSDSIYGVQADLGRRFGEDRQFGARANLAYRDGDTNIEKQDLEETVGSLGLDYSVERLRVTADIMYQRQDIDNVVRQFTVAPAVTKIPGAPDNDLNYPGVGHSEMKDTTLVARAEYDISEAVMVYAGYGDRNSKLDALAGNPALLNDAGDFSSSPAWQVYEVNSHSAQAGLNAEFATGAIKHAVTLGATRVAQNADISFLTTAFASRTSNIDDPIYEGTPSLDGYSANLLPYTQQELTSYAIADTLSFLDENVQLTLGARRQQVEIWNFNYSTGILTGSYDKSATTPSVGLVVKPWQHMSLYANYIEGLSPGSAPPPGVIGTPHAPLKTKQKEIGIKKEWDNLMTTLALFEIERPSELTENGYFGVNGEQRNRGLEFNVFGQASEQVRILGGASYTDGELTKTAAGAFNGNDPVAVPKLQVNLGAEWDTPFVNGLTLTSRVTHTGKQYVDQANNLDIPAVTYLDIGARYQTSVASKPLVLRANLYNVADKDYWGLANAGYLFIGTPRTLQLSATVDF